MAPLQIAGWVPLQIAGWVPLRIARSEEKKPARLPVCLIASVESHEAMARNNLSFLTTLSVFVSVKSHEAVAKKGHPESTRLAAPLPRQPWFSRPPQILLPFTLAEAFYHEQSHTAPLQEKTSASAPLVASESAQG